MTHALMTGGAHGWPFGRPLIDLGTRGYVEQEFSLAGKATTYRPVAGSAWGRDGVWQAEPRGTLPFKTRYLVYRPADPQRFNGTVIVCWNNVTAGYELFHGESSEVLEGGYAFVAATVQHVGVHGFASEPRGLAAWDPQRYGSLSIPSDEASYDIFAQIGRAVGPQRVRGALDPLGGLAVKHVIGIGASQSAARLATYLNAIHPLDRVFDGFMLEIYFGAGAALEGNPIVNPSDPDRRRPQGAHLLRELDVPVMIVNSELEAIASYAVRQADSDQLVTWEAAGATHVSAQVQALRNQKFQRDFGVMPEILADMNRVALTPFYDAALHQLRSWIVDGHRPPSQPRIQFAGDKPQVVRDQHGIAKGGARLPSVDAPVATHSSIPLTQDFHGALRGRSLPFGARKLEAMYGNEAGYLARFEEAAQRALRAGILCERDLAPALEEAAQEYRRSHAALP